MALSLYSLYVLLISGRDKGGKNVTKSYTCMNLVNWCDIPGCFSTKREERKGKKTFSSSNFSDIHSFSSTLS